MTSQRIEIPGYDWRVDLVYGATPKDTGFIVSKLWEMGCSHRHLTKAEGMIEEGKPNQGLTYSSKRTRHSLIVIGYATSVGEFISTVVHEVDHLTDHISQYYDIPYDSEENSYLIGDIAKIICEDAMEKAWRKVWRRM